MWRRGRRPGASRAAPQMHEGFNVMGLWEKVEKLYGSDFVTRRVGLFPGGHAFRLQKNCEIARKCRGVTRKIDNFRCLQFREFCGGGLTQARARRIENDQVGFFVKLLQELFGVSIV